MFFVKIVVNKCADRQILLKVHEEQTFESIVTSFEDGKYVKASQKTIIFIGNSFEKASLFEVSRSTTIAEAQLTFPDFTHILFHLKHDFPEEKCTNAFSAMMQNAKSIIFPSKDGRKYPGENVLYNKIVDFLESVGAGFMPHEAPQMEIFMKRVFEALW